MLRLDDQHKEKGMLDSRVRRVLFDLDGTLWDTQKFHAAAEASLVRQHGISIAPDELSARYAGWPTELVFKEVLGCNATLAGELTVQKWKEIFPRAAEARQLCNIRALLTELRRRCVTYAIGTASPAQWAIDLFAAHDLSDLIDVGDIVGGDMVAEGKPAPDIWLRAARGMPPRKCFVVEDGSAGIEAAVAAGISCALLLPRTHDRATQIHTVDEVLNLI